MQKRKFHLGALGLALVLSSLVSPGLLQAEDKPSPSPSPLPFAPLETIPAKAAMDIPLIGKTRVNRYILENGLTLLVHEDHRSPTVAYQTWFRVGSRNEKRGYTGLAHLFEHMMFKRTKNRAEGVFDKLLERAGAEGTNAFTSSDYTAYVVEIPKAHLELIMQLESDRMVNLLVDEAAFTTEREVVQNERRMRMENSPDGLMYQELMKMAYTKHSYGWPTIGYEEDLARMTVKDAEAFYKEYYHPSHATVVVVGDVDSNQVYEMAKRHYGSIPKQTVTHTPPEVEPEQTEPRRTTLKLNTQVQKLLMGFPIPNGRSPVTPVLDVIEAILSQGRANRLDRALVDTGIATGVGCEGGTNMDASLFYCSATLQDKKSAVLAEHIILDEIQRLKTKAVPEAEIARAKNLVMFSVLRGLTTSSSISSLLGSLECQYEGFENGVAILDRIQKVTAADIMAAAKVYLKPERRNVVIGVQK